MNFKVSWRKNIKLYKTAGKPLLYCETQKQSVKIFLWQILRMCFRKTKQNPRKQTKPKNNKHEGSTDGGSTGLSNLKLKLSPPFFCGVRLVLCSPVYRYNSTSTFLGSCSCRTVNELRIRSSRSLAWLLFQEIMVFDSS